LKQIKTIKNDHIFFIVIHKFDLKMISFIKQTITELFNMPAKYITDASGNRVLTEDYYPPSPPSPASPTSTEIPPPSPRFTVPTRTHTRTHTHAHTHAPPPIVRPSAWKNIVNDSVSWSGKDSQQSHADLSREKRFFHRSKITSRQQQAILKKQQKTEKLLAKNPDTIAA
jgi:hypothetical protein